MELSENATFVLFILLLVVMSVSNTYIEHTRPKKNEGGPHAQS